jgi:hypothetical protein
VRYEVLSRRAVKGRTYITRETLDFLELGNRVAVVLRRSRREGK